MAKKKLTEGQRVWFRGEADPDTGEMLAAFEDGPDWFLATVAYELGPAPGIYCLRFHSSEGSRPVGLPFPGDWLIPA